MNDQLLADIKRAHRQFRENVDTYEDIASSAASKNMFSESERAAITAITYDSAASVLRVIIRRHE